MICFLYTILLRSVANIRVEPTYAGQKRDFGALKRHRKKISKKLKKIKKTFKKVLTSRFECGIISYVASEEVKSDTTNSHMGV